MITYIRKSIAITVITTFIASSMHVPQAQAQGIPWMPKPGVRVGLSPAFVPAHLQGIVIHPDDALKFDFLIHQGDTPLNETQKKDEYQKLVQYFMASLTVPDDNQWVNLSPYEKNRIVEKDFGTTEMGRDLLAQDYLLKQIASSLMYPEEGLGKKFWNRVFERAQKELGTSNVPVNTINKVWIVPGKSTLFEKDNTVYILDTKLKVMMEEDYLALEKNALRQPGDIVSLGAVAPIEPVSSSTISSKVVREIIIPELEKEINEGKNFAPLRQVYHSMLLAAWYKRALKESLLGKVYANRAKVKGVDLNNPATNDEIYQQYLKAFKKGVFNYIKEDVDRLTKEQMPRKYFSGGTTGINDTTYREEVTVVPAVPPQLAGSARNTLGRIDRAIVAVNSNQAVSPIDAAMVTDHIKPDKKNVGPRTISNTFPEFHIYFVRYQMEEETFDYLEAIKLYGPRNAYIYWVFLSPDSFLAKELNRQSRWRAVNRAGQFLNRDARWAMMTGEEAVRTILNDGKTRRFTYPNPSPNDRIQPDKKGAGTRLVDNSFPDFHIYFNRYKLEEETFNYLQAIKFYGQRNAYIYWVFLSPDSFLAKELNQQSRWRAVDRAGEFLNRDSRWARMTGEQAVRAILNDGKDRTFTYPADAMVPVAPVNIKPAGDTIGIVQQLLKDRGLHPKYADFQTGAKIADEVKALLRQQGISENTTVSVYKAYASSQSRADTMVLRDVLLQIRKLNVSVAIILKGNGKLGLAVHYTQKVLIENPEGAKIQGDALELDQAMTAGLQKLAAGVVFTILLASGSLAEEAKAFSKGSTIPVLKSATIQSVKFKDGLELKVGDVFEKPRINIYDSKVGKSVAVAQVKVIGIEPYGTSGEVIIRTHYLGKDGNIISGVVHEQRTMPNRYEPPSWTLKEDPKEITLKDGFKIKLGGKYTLRFKGVNKEIVVGSIRSGEDGFGHRQYEIDFQDGESFIAMTFLPDFENKPPDLDAIINAVVIKGSLENGIYKSAFQPDGYRFIAVKDATGMVIWSRQKERGNSPVAMPAEVVGQRNVPRSIVEEYRGLKAGPDRAMASESAKEIAEQVDAVFNHPRDKQEYVPIFEQAQTKGVIGEDTKLAKIGLPHEMSIWGREDIGIALLSSAWTASVVFANGLDGQKVVVDGIEYVIGMRVTKVQRNPNGHPLHDPNIIISLFSADGSIAQESVMQLKLGRLRGETIFIAPRINQEGVLGQDVLKELIKTVLSYFPKNIKVVASEESNALFVDAMVDTATTDALQKYLLKFKLKGTKRNHELVDVVMGVIKHMDQQRLSGASWAAIIDGVGKALQGSTVGNINAGIVDEGKDGIDTDVQQQVSAIVRNIALTDQTLNLTANEIALIRGLLYHADRFMDGKKTYLYRAIDAKNPLKKKAGLALRVAKWLGATTGTLIVLTVGVGLRGFYLYNQDLEKLRLKEAGEIVAGMTHTFTGDEANEYQPLFPNDNITPELLSKGADLAYRAVNERRYFTSTNQYAIIYVPKIIVEGGSMVARHYVNPDEFRSYYGIFNLPEKERLAREHNVRFFVWGPKHVKQDGDGQAFDAYDATAVAVVENAYNVHYKVREGGPNTFEEILTELGLIKDGMTKEQKEQVISRLERLRANNAFGLQKFTIPVGKNVDLIVRVDEISDLRDKLGVQVLDVRTGVFAPLTSERLIELFSRLDTPYVIQDVSPKTAPIDTGILDNISVPLDASVGNAGEVVVKSVEVTTTPEVNSPVVVQPTVQTQELPPDIVKDNVLQRQYDQAKDEVARARSQLQRLLKIRPTHGAPDAKFVLPKIQQARGLLKQAEARLGVAKSKLDYSAAIRGAINSRELGGIDLNAANADIQIKRDGKGVPLPLSQQNMEMLMKIDGFVPVIIDIKPIIDLPLFGQLKNQFTSTTKNTMASAT